MQLTRPALLRALSALPLTALPPTAWSDEEVQVLPLSLCGGAYCVQFTIDKQPFRAGSLAGYRSRQFAPGAKSMISATISGIAKSMPPPQKTAKSDNGSWTSHNKEILDRDNYRPDGVLPGFTGTFRR